MDKLSIYEFGCRLLETKDLDPVYVLLHHTTMSELTRRRWLLAYWCFYHVGTASWIAEEPAEYNFWVRMKTAANSKEYPRSSERRHFRANNAIKSVTWLESKGLNQLFTPLRKFSTSTEVINYVKTWVGFGPWIAFKVADMVERLGIAKIEFGVDDAMLFDSPQEGARLLWNKERPNEAEPTKSTIAAWAVSRILQELQLTKHVKAPLSYDRNIGVQEAETILCKWKSYLVSNGGRYLIGEDIDHCLKGLEMFPDCELTQRLVRGGKLGGLW